MSETIGAILQVEKTLERRRLDVQSVPARMEPKSSAKSKQGYWMAAI
jgi:hypothetical protein